MSRELCRAGIDETVDADVVIVGSGAAGLTAAVGLAGMRVVVLTKTAVGEGAASAWAQGGVAAAVGAGDSPAQHAADTVAVSDGLADLASVELLTCGADERIRFLLEIGAELDRDGEQRLALGQEAGHSRRRILHARGDQTGAELVRALSQAARCQPGLSLAERTFALDLVVDEGRVAGLIARDSRGRRLLYRSSAVVLATGGIGRLYAHTTNPAPLTGDGLAMAARAGARLMDLEFVQFHPTALASGRDPMPLVTEALRGEGAAVVDDAGRRFLAEVHPAAELAPRDVVARAVWAVISGGGRAYIDARGAVGERFPTRFPGVFALCQRDGIDPRRALIPIAPAAHYHIGGIAVDGRGRSSVAGLWAAGEDACTGVHGANRLASNSLLEAMVFAARLAEDLRGRHGNAGRAKPVIPARGAARFATLEALAPHEVEALRRLRQRMWQDVGLVRDRQGLEAALAELDQVGRLLEPIEGEPTNVAQVARLVATAALWRSESRGVHYRADCSQAGRGEPRHLTLVDGLLEPSWAKVA